MFNDIILEIKGDIAVITLNRPQYMNTCTVQMGNELMQAWDELEKNDSIRVAILTGAGHIFSAGMDRSVLASADPTASVKVMERLANFKKPIISAVERYALGFGAQSMLGCDIIIAAEGTKIGFIGAAASGLCSLAMNYLPLQIGRAKAMEMMLTCEHMDAQEALRIGLINKVVPAEKLMEAAFEMAEKIKRVAPMSARLTKEGVALNLGGVGNVDFLKRVLPGLATSEDRQEASRAFAEKRKPAWKGR